MIGLVLKRSFRPNDCCWGRGIQLSAGLCIVHAFNTRIFLPVKVFASDLGVELNFDELPFSEARAFSIDDSTTTEIDDCLSVSRTASGSLRIGVHIAAPGLGDFARRAGAI